VPRGLRIARVISGAPAAKAGFRVNDEIVAVNGRSIARQATQRATSDIRGLPGTTVRLTILSRGHHRNVTLTRANVADDVVDSALRKLGTTPIGVVRLDSFTSGAHGEVRKAIDRMVKHGAKGIVLDLRGNGGGLLDEAVLISSIFIKEGTIVTTRGRHRSEKVFRATGSAISGRIGVVVLVDRNSASASEIVTGALQDRKRAIVVGTRTFGKGVFQSVLELPNGGALDITVGQYFLPSGRNIGGQGVKQGHGIAPDVAAQDNPKTKPDEGLQRALDVAAARVR
jgi:carboxyl-terminal processing protease